MEYIWIVYESNHGAVSFFDSIEKAIEEMEKIAHNIYEASIRTITQEEDYATILLEDYEMIFAKKVELNRSWVD